MMDAEWGLDSGYFVLTENEVSDLEATFAAPKENAL
ncbi:MAG: hypothetical protein QOG67_847 [Verrucomicrobiota bacterium]|jgi:hypothetical protein